MHDESKRNMSVIEKRSNDSRLVVSSDIPVFELINAQRNHPLVLVCEHGGQAIPEKLGNLGLSTQVLDRHIAWDIGAAGLTRKIAHILGAPAILQNYSRLVIDCNRPPDQPDSVPETSDQTTIPGNINLSQDARNQRVDEIFTPFHNKVATLLDQYPRQITLAIHSFTPVLADTHRPWDIGFLFRNETRTSARLASYLSKSHTALQIGMNEPYNISNDTDWFVPVHGEQRGLPHSLVEVRNDHLLDEAGQQWWAEVLSLAIKNFLKEF